MRILRPCIIVLAVVLSAGSVYALDYTLNEKEQARLTPEALVEYQKADWALDHILLDKAMSHFQAAQAADPGNAPIRLLAAKFATSEGRKAREDGAIRLFRIAEKAYQEVLDMPAETVKPSERKQAEDGLTMVRDFITKQAERDARRLAVGKEIVKERAKELYPPKKVPTPAPAPTPGTGQPNQPPGGMMMDPSMMGMY